MQFAHLAQRLFNTPLAIHPRKAEVVMASLAERLGVSSMTRLNGETLALTPHAFMDDDDEEFTTERRTVRTDAGYDLIGPVARIPVTGTLVQKLGSLRPYSGMTGYDGIRQAFCRAMDDDDAKAIMLDIDSPGGEVAGCFDLVDLIHSARGDKPIASVLNESAYSAAYAIGSAADPGRLYVPRTGGTGSIGVIMLHVDISKALSKAGIEVTFITKGARKADGHSELPLSEEALALMQADINAIGALFDETVARNRNMPVAAISATEAQTYLGANGVAAGLADAVMAPDAAFRALLAVVA